MPPCRQTLFLPPMLQERVCPGRGSRQSRGVHFYARDECIQEGHLAVKGHRWPLKGGLVLSVDPCPLWAGLSEGPFPSPTFRSLRLSSPFCCLRPALLGLVVMPPEGMTLSLPLTERHTMPNRGEVHRAVPQSL